MLNYSKNYLVHVLLSCVVLLYGPKSILSFMTYPIVTSYYHTNNAPLSYSALVPKSKEHLIHAGVTS